MHRYAHLKFSYRRLESSAVSPMQRIQRKVMRSVSVEQSNFSVRSSAGRLLDVNNSDICWINCGTSFTPLSNQLGLSLCGWLSTLVEWLQKSEHPSLHYTMMLSLRFIFRLNQFLSESITGTLAPVTVTRLFFHTLTHVMTHIRLMACQ